MNRYTREIVGWDISTKHTKNLIISVFLNAFKTDLGLEFDRFIGVGEMVEAIS